MPHTPSSDFIEEKNKAENKPLFLYTIYNWDGADNNLYYAAWDTDITFDGQLYTRFPISHEKTSENTQGQIDTVQIMVSNVSRFIIGTLLAYEFRGLRVEIKSIFSDILDDTDACINYIYYIDAWTADDKNAVFTLTSKFNIQNIELPLRRYSRHSCDSVFKSSECGYTGVETECNKTLTRCRELGNQSRIGAEPSIPDSRILIR